MCSEFLGLGGKIGHQLCSRRALSHVREFFTEMQIFLSQFTKQVSDDLAVV